MTECYRNAWRDRHSRGVSARGSGRAQDAAGKSTGLSELRGAGENIPEYTIYHSPLAFVRTLLELGAEPNYEDPAGFPSLIDAKLIQLLLSRGADPNARTGIDDYTTPLEEAENRNLTEAVKILKQAGASRR